MFAEAVAYVLDRAGFEAVMAHDSRLALDHAKNFQPDLYILSSALLPVSASLLCCELRHAAGPECHPPILMLGTDPLEETRVAMLDCGVDDYMVKPFGMKEFMARVFALLRRANVPLEVLAGEEVRAGKFLLNAATRILKVDAGPDFTSILLTPKETQLLHILMNNPGSVISRETLIQRVWGQTNPTDGHFGTLDVHMRYLRRKVEGGSGPPQHIIVVRGSGFRFEV